MKQRHFRIGKLDSAGSIASENRKIYCELRRGKIDGPLASRLTAILIGQKGIIESSETEAKLDQLETRINDLLAKGAGGNVVTFKKAGGPFEKG